jgi:hypothetical protein
MIVRASGAYEKRKFFELNFKINFLQLLPMVMLNFAYVDWYFLNNSTINKISFTFSFLLLELMFISWNTLFRNTSYFWLSMLKNTLRMVYERFIKFVININKSNWECHSTWTKSICKRTIIIRWNSWRLSRFNTAIGNISHDRLIMLFTHRWTSF